jgi:hypothetical protein
MRMRHFVIRGLSGSRSSTLSHKRHDIREKVTEYKMCVLIFSTTFVWNIFDSKKNWARYDQKCKLDFMWSTGYCGGQILKKLEFTQQIFEKKIFKYRIS